MKKEPKGLRKKILDRMKEVNCWVHKGDIDIRAIEWGYLAGTADRRCREMVSGKLSNGKTCPIVLEKKSAGKSVMYKYKLQEKFITKPIFLSNGTVRIEKIKIYA